MDGTRKYEPKFTYYIYDETSEDGTPLTIFNADHMEASAFPALAFLDDNGNMVGLHHLAPGHTVMLTDMDGYSLQEKPPAE